MKYYLSVILLIIVMHSAFSQQGSQNLRQLSCQGDLSKLESYLVGDANINVSDKHGNTLLHHAVLCNQEKSFDYLIKKGINMNIKNKGDFTPLLLAILRGNVSFAKKLLNLGAKANFNFKKPDGTSILMVSILNGYLPVAKLLMENGANVNASNQHGNTPLGIARREGLNEIAILLIKNGATKEGVKTPELKGAYLGQELPSTTAKVFAPNFISTESPVQNGIFHPNGQEFYFSLHGQKHNGGTIMVSKLIDGTWTKPEPALAPNKHHEVGPFISKDGSKLYYASTKPIKEKKGSRPDIDLWYVERDGDTWSTPKHMGPNINSEQQDYFPSIADSGTMYFFRYSKKGPGDLFYAVQKNGIYQKAVLVEGVGNETYHNYDPYVAPDESYLIFASGRRPDGKGQSDLYISFRNKEGKWGSPKNMGEGINTKKSEYAPLVTHDGKYLFFARGHGDIYWVDMKVVKNLQ